jgi:hypothetical protein
MELSKVKNNTPDVFSDPFSMNCVDNIWFSIRKRRNTQKFCTSASIEFINNNTKGEQRFEAEDFQTVVLQVENFIKQL